MRSIFTIIGFLVFFIPVTTRAQSSVKYKGETINALTADGKKTGIWKLFDEPNNRSIVMQFKDGEEIAPAKYYKDNKLVAIRDLSGVMTMYRENDTIRLSKSTDETGKRAIIDGTGKQVDEETKKAYDQMNTIGEYFYGGTREMYNQVAHIMGGAVEDSGRVELSVVIDTNGVVEKVTVTKSTNEALNEDAIKIAKQLPRWQPNYSNGRFTKQIFLLPITFSE